MQAFAITIDDNTSPTMVAQHILEVYRGLLGEQGGVQEFLDAKIQPLRDSQTIAVCALLGAILARNFVEPAPMPAMTTTQDPLDMLPTWGVGLGMLGDSPGAEPSVDAMCDILDSLAVDNQEVLGVR